MSTAAGELTQAVFRRVADFVRRLPPDQLESLARGETTLALVPRPIPPPRLPASPVAAADVRVALSAVDDRASAERYLDGLRLSAAQLRALADALGLAVAAGVTKAAVRDTIVQWTVGRRVDAAVLGRPAPR